MDWTEPRIDKLRDLVSLGAKMAVMLQHFPEATRGAIMGQKNRLGLCDPASVVTARRASAARANAAEIAKRRAVAAERRQTRRRAHDAEQRQTAYVPVCRDLPDGTVDIHRLRNGMCCFPFDAPPGAELSVVYCGAATVDQSWCADHRRIVYQSARS